MKNIFFRNYITKLLAVIFTLGYSLANAQVRPGGGGGAVGPGAPTPQTPIDMYEGALLLVAVLLIVGYYLYTRNRKALQG